MPSKNHTLSNVLKAHQEGSLNIEQVFEYILKKSIDEILRKKNKDASMLKSFLKSK